MKVLLSEEAHYDIDSIYEYISFYSQKYANQTVKRLYASINKLFHSPYLGRYVPEFSNKHYLELLHKNYRIVYSFIEKENIVYIHFIVHAKRDINSFFKSYISKNKKYFN